MLELFLAAIIATKTINSDETIRLYDDVAVCEQGRYWATLVDKKGEIVDTGCWWYNLEDERFVVKWDSINANIHYLKAGTKKKVRRMEWGAFAAPLAAMPIILTTEKEEKPVSP